MPLSSSRRTDTDLVVTWRFGTSRAAVWGQLVDVASFPAWLGTVTSGAVRVGDTLVVEHGADYACTSVVHAVEPERVLAMSWHFPDEHPTELTVELADVDGGTAMRLRHLGLGSLGISYEPGWITHLSYFEASLAGAPLPMSSFWDLYATLARLTASTADDARAADR